MVNDTLVAGMGELLEMLRHSGATVLSFEKLSDTQFRIRLQVIKTHAFDGVNFNKTQSIPRWQQFGFKVENIHER